MSNYELYDDGFLVFESIAYLTKDEQELYMKEILKDDYFLDKNLKSEDYDNINDFLLSFDDDGEINYAEIFKRLFPKKYIEVIS